MKLKSLLICLGVLFLYSCQDDQANNGQATAGGAKARFTLQLPDYTQVGTRLTNETSITDVTVLQFVDGSLKKKIELNEQYWGAAVETDQLEAMQASKLDENGALIVSDDVNVMVVLANFNSALSGYFVDVKDDMSYKDFLALNAKLPDAQTLADLEYTPMTGFYYGGVTPDITNQINVTLTRALAKINFVLDTANFKVDGKPVSVYVNTIELRNVPLEVTLFETDRPSLPAGTQPGAWAGQVKLYPAYAADNFGTLDASHNQSITPLTGFIGYMPENVRGSYAGITSNADKRPDATAVPDGQREGWTHIYVKLDYISIEGLSGTAEYRIYLGGNDKGDINILSGVQYNVTTYLYGANDKDTRITVQASFDPRPKEGQNDGVEILGMANSYIINNKDLKSADNKPLVLPLTQARKGWLAIQSEIQNAEGMAAYQTVAAEFDALIQRGNWEIVTLWKTDPTANVAVKGAPAAGIVTKGGDDVSNKYYATLELTNATPLTMGHNYVIGLKDKDEGKIWWSWHLWVTDYAPNPDGTAVNGEVHTYKSVAFGANGLYKGKVMMDRNLGATGLRDDLTDGRIDPPATGAKAAKWYGLMYQWGRKDPFTPTDGSSTTGGAVTSAIKIYDADDNQLATGSFGITSTNDTDGFPKIDANNTNKLVEAAHKPYVFFYNSSGIFNYPWTFPHVNDAWGGTSNLKTAFDPCPPGWRISKGGATTENNVWAGFNGQGWNNATNISFNSGEYNILPEEFKMYGSGAPLDGTANTANATKGRYYNDDAGTKAWYPASGYRTALGGVFYSVGTHGYSWAATVTGSGGYYLGFSSTDVNPQGNNARALGFPVRCVSE